MSLGNAWDSFPEPMRGRSAQAPSVSPIARSCHCPGFRPERIPWPVYPLLGATPTRREAMDINDKLNLDELSLEPLETADATPSGPGKAKFQIDTRSGGDRRTCPDRRQSIRFEKDRRQGDRRSKGDPWGRGS